ncbi:MAG: PilN domain-containing protein, partial [Candidatus Rokubacteria bacterium]|nr:PilN domain-containing protein [Candidatus Rokubacteria bacterium]
HVETFVVEAEQPAAALRAALDQRRLSSRVVHLGLPRASVTVKPIELPTVTGGLREMVQFELERHLPFPSDDAPFDLVPLTTDGEAAAGEGRHVLVAAADRRVVDAATRMMDEARLRTVSVTVASHNLVGLVEPRRGARTVWVHHVGDSAELLLLRGGSLVLSRSVPADDAVIAEEIRRSFTITKWRACEAVWLSGDTAPLEAPSTSALADLGVPVTEPPWTTRARKLLATITEEPRGAAMLAAAVAAGPRVRPLDLVPPAQRARTVTRPQLATAGLVAATVILGIGALLVPGIRQSRELRQVNAQITTLDPQVKSVEQTLTELERKRRLLATIQSVQSTSIRPLPVLRELTELLPNDAWLTTLSFETKGIELTGQAAAASALIPLLENSARLERVEFASPVTRGRDREQFRIRAAWEPGGASAPTRPAAPAPAPAAAAPRPAGDGAPAIEPPQTPPPPSSPRRPMNPNARGAPTS